MSRSFSFLLAGLICGPVPGHAEDLVLEEIRVVAQKRTEALQSVPLSVAVLSENDLRETGTTDLFDVAQLIPSLSVFQNAGPINTSFRLRGIGNEANIPNFEPGVGLFVDGVFRTRSGVGIGDLFDVERIEILRGPQSTLYGKSTTAGVINVISKRPDDALEISGEVTLGELEGGNNAEITAVRASVSGPLAANAKGRLAGAFFDHGHSMVNLFNADHSDDMTRHSLRGQLLFQPHEQLEVRLIAGKFSIDSANNGDPDIDEGVAIGAINIAFGVPCTPNSASDRAFCSNAAGIVDLDTLDATLDIVQRTDRYTLTAISGYESYDMTRSFDGDQLNIELLSVTDRQTSASLSQEIRIGSNAGAGPNWLAGIYYYRNDFERGDPLWPTAVLGTAAPLLGPMPGVAFGQTGDAGFFDSLTQTRHASVFGHVIWDIGNAFTLTTGARWQEEDKQTTIRNSADHVRPTLITVGLLPTAGNANLARDARDLTGNLIGSFRWSSELMTYGSISTGFKSGGFNAGFGAVPATDREFNDETVISYELGARANLVNDRVQLNASVFRSEYDNYQAAGFVGLRFLVNNAERVKVSGFEVDGQAILTERLRAVAAISHADAAYGLYTGGACHFERLPDNDDGSACELTGLPLPLAPKWQTRVSLAYEHRAGPITWYARGDWTWVDEYYTNATLDPRHIQAAYSTLDLRAGLQRGRFDVALWIKNAGDTTFVMQDGATNLFPDDPAFARYLGKPRSYGLTLRGRW